VGEACNLAVRDIQEKLLPHPLAPFLKPLGMTGGAEPSGVAGKYQRDRSLLFGIA